MQKFRDYIYCDDIRIDSYINQIPELNKIATSESYETETEVEGGLDIRLAKTGTTLTEKNSINYIMKPSSLEQIVNWAFNENNAINYEGENLEAEDKDKLIIFNGKMSMPEMSENIEMVNAIARNTSLFDVVSISDEDKKTMSYIKESDNVPILLEVDSDYIFNCNLKKGCITENKDDFFDNIDNEITIIGKIDKIYNSKEEIEIYDLVKEVFKLNRSIRRKLPKELLKDAIIYEKGPLVKITPIIIYK